MKEFKLLATIYIVVLASARFIDLIVTEAFSKVPKEVGQITSWFTWSTIVCIILMIISLITRLESKNRSLKNDLSDNADFSTLLNFFSWLLVYGGLTMTLIGCFTYFVGYSSLAHTGLVLLVIGHFLETLLTLASNENTWLFSTSNNS